MIAGMLVISPVSAAEIGKTETGYTPEGTAISSAAEFAAMSADGKYYLAADITISATWNAGTAVSTTYSANTPFTGTFDGNGHTVTTTVPLFATLEGTVKNLTVEGEIASRSGHNSAVAIYTSGVVIFENIYVKANILGGTYCGSLLGYGIDGAYVTVKNCRNDGDISATQHVGGILGFVQDNYIYAENCVNYGDLTSSTKYSGGIAAVAGNGSAANIDNDTYMVFKNCQNYGKVYGTSGRCGGIVAYARGYIVVEGCDNYGEVENTGGMAAGIVGTSDVETAKSSGMLITKCRNFGDVKGATTVAGIVAQLGGAVGAHASYRYEISACENHGDIYATPSAAIDSTSSAIYACGLAGYVFGGATGNRIINNINTGDLYCDNTATNNKAYVCGLFGYLNGGAYMAQNNISTANFDIKGSTYAVSLTFYNKATGTATKNNYAVGRQYNGKDIASVLFTTSMTDPKNDSYVKVVTDAQIESGEVAYLANAGAGKSLFFQKIGTDKTPSVMNDGTNAIDKSGSAYVNVAVDTESLFTSDFPSLDVEIPDDNGSTPAPDVSDIPVPSFPKKEVTLPAAGNVGKVEAGYTPEGTAITNAAEFAAMTSDGKYYLANDITITSSYVNSFTGTFDGNGKTVTTTVALFNSFNGTVKNLTGEGDVAAVSGNNGAVAASSSTGKATFENIYNKANVLGGQYCAGIVGYVAYGSADFTIEIVNCRNDGTISGRKHIGGMVGYSEGRNMYIAKSVNCGDIVSEVKDEETYVSGIIGRFGKDTAVAGTSRCKILECENYGTVSAVSGFTTGMLSYVSGLADIDTCTNYGTIINRARTAAGIFGYAINDAENCGIQIEFCRNYGTIASGASASGIAGRVGNATNADYFVYNVENCENHGDIYSISFTGVQYAAYACGVVGYALGGAHRIEGCINTGNIVIDSTKTTKGAYVAGILGYVNGSSYTIKNNINTGSISITGSTTIATLTAYNKSTASPNIANNYSTASGNLPVILIGSASTTNESVAKIVTAEQLASGEIAYLINKAMGKDVAFQNLGEDALPTFIDTTRKSVIKNADGTYANKVEDVTPPASEETTPPADDTTAPSDETTNVPEATEPNAESTTVSPNVTTEAPASSEKSCGGMSFAPVFAMLVSALAAAFVFGKKKI